MAGTEINQNKHLVFISYSKYYPYCYNNKTSMNLPNSANKLKVFKLADLPEFDLFAGMAAFT